MICDRITCILGHIVGYLDPMNGLNTPISSKQLADKITDLQSFQIDNIASLIRNKIAESLNCSESTEFRRTLKDKIKKILEDSFSTPNQFIENGVDFYLSDLIPQSEVPSGYSLNLKLDKSLTQQKSELVFILSQSNKDGSSTDKFTLNELAETLHQF